MIVAHHNDGGSYWAHTAVEAAPSPALVGEVSCDVLVIGAGFTGLRAAHKLAAKGVRVAVIDAGDVGYGASGRNGGQVNPLLPFNDPDQLRKKLGTTYFERLCTASLGSADSLFDYIRDNQIDCQARQKGWLRVDHYAGAKRQSHAIAKRWNAYGADLQFLDREAVQKLSGSTAYASGVFAPKGGAVQPLSLVRGIARLAQAVGARIYGQTAAEKLIQQSHGWRIDTAQGQVQANWVILATNGYTDGLWPRLRSTLLPLVSIQIATEAMDDATTHSLLPGGSTISDTRRVIMYARREPDNRLIFGGHGNMSRSGQLSGFDWLRRDALRIFPQLHGVRWAFEWGGRIALTHDRLPHYHEPAKGLICGLGYNGRGVAMANLMGTILADRILGAAPESLPFPISQIKKMPYRNVQLAGKGTAIWLMKLKDRLEVSAG